VTNRFRRAFFLGVVLFGTCDVLLSAQQPHGSEPEASTSVPQDAELRGVFLGKEDDPVQAHRIVGRLAILLKTDNGFQRVRSDYSFRSGDRFRFEITANQDGWLYVMHAVSGGAWQPLWPARVGANTNKVKSEQICEIPPAPGIFVFDKDTGNEFFYVVIRSDHTPPGQAASMPVGHTQQPVKTQASPGKAASGETINFLVRDPFGETTRGVVFDPGKDDSDPYLYFSAAIQDRAKTAKVTFQLHHID
jgi:Domain of unknown function (DUF4384)